MAGPDPLDPASALDRFRLDDRVAMVTGASSGLGERFARVLAGVGAKVVLAARRADRLEALAADLPDALAVAVDVTDPDGPQRLIDATVGHYGRLDVLVNAAGISRVLPAVDDEIDGFRHELEVDLIAPYELARRAARWWIANDHPGVVVNLGSVLGVGSGGRLRVPGYATAKGGLHNLTRELAVQWARKGIRVNALAPAWFETEMNSADMFHTDSGRAYIESGTPMGRGGLEHELDGALLLLATDAGSYLTGHVLLVDGGWTLKRLHRQIMLSATYRMSSRGNPKALAADPTNRLFWRYNMRRLSAEEIRDSVLAVNGALNREKMFGPSIFTIIPREILHGQSQPGANWGRSSPADRNRRSIYVHVKRSLVVPMFESFDAPDLDNSCPVRFTTTQPTQSLALLNSLFSQREAGVFAEYLRKQAGNDTTAQVSLALKRSLQRPPTDAEVRRGTALIAALQSQDKASPELALKVFCLLALNLNEFLYLD